MWCVVMKMASCVRFIMSVATMGWTYGFNGSLLKATRLTGIKNFDVKEFGLIPLRVAVWGPFILLNLEKDSFSKQGCDDDVGMEWLGSASNILTCCMISMRRVPNRVRPTYSIPSGSGPGERVFVENHIDDGYHVPFVHKDLPGLDQLDSLSTTCIWVAIFLTVSCFGMAYARYGPWMETNLVLPLGPGRSKVIFDYFLDASLKDDEAFVTKSLEENEKLQKEDFVLCEAVQRGLESPAYDSGRYVPMAEKAMHHFHCLLHQNLIK
ncbi:hypothetical protein M8C21_020975 [Ambrosia artemisiifolia]|uniref:Choline monooxygenase, chloroplastic n=1 Tax=Ambrosia artemisiifolia TaxID=4212 RepID=A0AAD5CUV5_AMBAR|nr:hypothetical protein M8C21_020975 [Ambrosia artemisiifolia]